MALVGYSDSEEEDEVPATRPAKKQKVPGGEANELPPLPTAFHDLYSSTVRTSTQDDPSLHAGRKRVTPHVEGNWPTHVYLEWHPKSEETKLLADLIAAQRPVTRPASKPATDTSIRGLLHNELGVSLPLHVSLSRPLVLRTEQRAAFLDQLRKSIQSSGVRTFSAQLAALRWHPNETGSRYFLVLNLQKPENDEMRRLLATSNGVAGAFKQPLLYHEDSSGEPKTIGTANDVTGEATHGKFHISLAWSLSPPASINQYPPDAHRRNGNTTSATKHSELPAAAKDLTITFSEVKIRIGQDVSTIPLPATRRKGGLF